MINEMRTTTSLSPSANQPLEIGGTYPPIMRLQTHDGMAVIRPPFFFDLVNDNDYHYRLGVTFCHMYNLSIYDIMIL